MSIAISNAQAGVLPVLPIDFYDALWTLYAPGTPAKRKEVFEYAFQVGRAELPDEMGDLAVFATFDLTFWSAFWLWRFENGDDCDSPCVLFRLPIYPP